MQRSCSGSMEACGLAAGATGPAPSCYTGSKPSENALLKVDNGTGSIGWVDNGMGSRWSPVGVATYTEKGDPHNIVLVCHTRSRWSNTVELKGNTFTRKTGNFDWMDSDMDSIPCLEKSLANVTTPNGRDDFQPFLLISTVPSRCMRETANWKVDSETGSLKSMGSDLDSISGLNNLSGDPPCAAPKCSELEETANPEIDTLVSGMGNFDFMDSGLESISCLGMSSVDATTPSGKRDPPSVAPSRYTGSKLRETTNLRPAHPLARESRSRMSHLRLFWRTLKCPRDCANWLRSLVPARPSQAPWGSGPSSWMLPRTMFGLCPKVCWLP